MKFFTNKKNGKKITIILLIIMLFNLVSPRISQAGWDEFGGKLFKPIAQLLRGVGDLTIQGLQLIFIGTSNLMEYYDPDPNSSLWVSYQIKYSPGLIFSNRVGLDVNFINPADDIEIFELVDLDYDETAIAKADSFESLMKGSDVWKVLTDLGYTSGTDAYEKKKAEFTELMEEQEKLRLEDRKYGEKIGNYSYGYRKVFTFEGKTYALLDGGLGSEVGYFLVYHTDKSTGNTLKIEQASKTLQPTVATWYKALRAIALVGLLSVLVYVGIRILISSTGQEKAKYKKMIIDWLSALCLLFVLHYIMLFTLEMSS